MNALDSIPLEQAERQEAEHWWPKPLPRHCQSKFYTARSRTWAGWSSVVFVHESPTHSARFDAENGLYLFALTVPKNALVKWREIAVTDEGVMPSGDSDVRLAVDDEVKVIRIDHLASIVMPGARPVQ